VPGPEVVSWTALSSAIWAYGPMPGIELIPYFLGLLAWVGLALAGIFRLPIAALVRWVRSRSGTSRQQAAPLAAPALESAGEGNCDHVR
jgi:hypothetical protein